MLSVIVPSTMASARRTTRTTREDDLLKLRALHAYVKYPRTGQPHAAFDDIRAAVVEIRGFVYVTLKSGRRQIAVFRLRGDGQLRRLVRLPKELRSDDE